MPASFAYNERKLLDELANNNAEAFRQLYELYWGKIYAASAFYLKDKSTAEDIVQETFLRIWIKREQLPGIQNFGHYIQTIARNLIISLLRKKIHHDSFELSATGDPQENNWKPSQQLEAMEITELIKKAVNRLSPKQKQIYLLSSEKQLSLKELAAELNISYDTARQYKSEALKFIRGFLAENACQLPFFIITTLFL